MPVFCPLRVAVICSSNMNRSMEAHAFLSKKGFLVKSFGTGDKVKLPGTAPDKPNCYEFGVTYEEIYQDLLLKDKSLSKAAEMRWLFRGNFDTTLATVIQLFWQIIYTQNGLLHMLDRNRRIKPRPERFQTSKDKFDILVTCEERVYDQVIEALENRTPTDNSAVHVINIDIQDNHEEATIGAFLVCELITMMAQSEDLDNDIDEMLHEFESKCQRPILHCVLFY